MRFRTSFAGCALVTAVVTSPALADPLPKPVAAALGAIGETELRADVTFLASDALLGRMSLEPGDDAAIAWIVSEFAKAGLQPAATDAAGRPTYLQPVPLIEYRSDPHASYIALGAQRFSPPEFVGGYRDDLDLTAPLVFAGYGITVPGLGPDLGYDDYRGIDAKGKIALVFDHEPQEDDPSSVFNGAGNTRHATSRVKALNAQAHGALAVIVMPEPNRKHLSNAERAKRIGGSVTRVPSIPVQARADDELHIPILSLTDPVTKALFAAAGLDASALQAAIDHDLAPHGAAMATAPLHVHLENTERRHGMSYNVAAILPGSDPKLAGETLIVSGHHDHDGSAMNGTQIWHGADDNASGTVGVVALARAFAAMPVRPKRSILFAVFAAEERGLLGAYEMAAHPLRPLGTTRAMINFDMIGRNETASPQTDGLITIPADTTNRLNLIGAPYSPDFNAAIVAANRSVGLDLDDRFDRDNVLNVFFRSDQFPFVLHDIPAFWFFTGFHPDYHHETDTADKINYTKMAKILRLSGTTLWDLGNARTVPAFVANPAGKPNPSR
jgi:Zn-dependent M28 family amino/carboxypeptidase